VSDSFEPLVRVRRGGAERDFTQGRGYRPQLGAGLALHALRQKHKGGPAQGDSDAPEDARPYISDGNFERLRRAQELGEAESFTGRHVALAFVLLQPFPVVALVGASSVNRFEDALGALDVELTPDEIDYLDLRDA
jgi:aryl-alcohol dehydrogenase-like predicted oxidoreductase